MPARRYMYIALIFLPIFAFSINYSIKGYIKNKHTKNPIKVAGLNKSSVSVVPKPWKDKEMAINIPVIQKIISRNHANLNNVLDSDNFNSS